MEWNIPLYSFTGQLLSSLPFAKGADMSPTKFELRLRLFSLSLQDDGDEGIRTPDPLLARQVLSQLSYTPVGFLYSFLPLFNGYGLKWTRTIDLTLIRRAL